MKKVTLRTRLFLSQDTICCGESCVLGPIPIVLLWFVAT